MNYPSTSSEDAAVLERLRRVAIRAVQAGAAIVQRHRYDFSVKQKGRNDLVTSADLASQEAIEAVIRHEFPGHLFVGEELGANVAATATAQHSDLHVWIVDPIDGTANFVHGLPGYAVSVAVARNGIPLVGVVLDPVSGEMFVGVRGAGASLNEKRIRVTDCRTLGEAMVACSFPPDTKRNSVEVTRFALMLERCQSMRRLGSAALNLCYVASGRLDAYWATCVNAWDVAAGFLILQESGGCLLGLDGNLVDLWNPKFIASSTETLNHEIATTLMDSAANPTTNR